MQAAITPSGNSGKAPNEKGVGKREGDKIKQTKDDIVNKVCDKLWNEYSKG